MIAFGEETHVAESLEILVNAVERSDVLFAADDEVILAVLFHAADETAVGSGHRIETDSRLADYLIAEARLPDENDIRDAIEHLTQKAIFEPQWGPSHGQRGQAGKLPAGDFLDRLGALVVDHDDVLGSGNGGDKHREGARQLRCFNDDAVGASRVSQNSGEQANDDSQP